MCLDHLASRRSSTTPTPYHHDALDSCGTEKKSDCFICFSGAVDVLVFDFASASTRIMST